MAGREHLDEPALDGAEAERLGLEMALRVTPIKVMHPAAFDQRPIGGRHAARIQRAGEVDVVLVLRIVAANTPGVPHRLHHLFIGERPGTPRRRLELARRVLHGQPHR